MPKILIVDDEWLTRLEIEGMLTNLGYDVAGQAETGAEAVALARELNPDLILMDVKMPGEMTGIDAAREIKAELKIPIVFISGYGDPEHIEAAKEIAPFGYVMKPFDEREVHAFVEIALSRRKLELELEKSHERLEQTNLVLQKEIATRKRTEKALLESEIKFRTVFEQAGDAIWIVDLDTYSLLDFNNLAHESLGYTRDEFKNLKVSDIEAIETPEVVRKHIDHIAQKGLDDFESQHKTKEGKTKDVSLTGRTITLGGKKFGVAISHDLTFRKQIEEKLRESEEKYRSMMEAMKDPTYICSPDFRVEYMNPAMVKRTGRDAIGEPCYKVINELDEKCPWCVHNKVQQGESLKTETTSPKDSRSYNISNSPIFHQDGSISKMTIYRDITEYKQAEEALRYFQKAIDSASDAIGMSTPEGKHYYQNKVFTELFGLTIKETDGEQGPPSTVYSNKKTGREVFETIMEGGSWTGEVKMLDKNRKEIDVFLRAYSIKNKKGNVVGLVGVHTDIASRKQAEEALRESEKLHKKAQSVAHIGHWELNPEIGTPVWSDEIFRIFGLNPQESEPSFTDHETHLYPDDWPLLNKAVTLASTEGTPFDIIFRIVRSDGEIRWMHSIGTTTKDEKGKVTKLFGTAQDISERKRTEQALKNNQNFLNRIIDQSSFATWISDEKGTMIKCNAALKTFLNITDEQLIGKYNVFEDEVAIEQGLMPKIRTVFEEGKTANFSVEWDANELGYKEAKKVYIEGTMFPIHDDKGDLTNVVNHWIDITERKQAEEALRKSEKRMKGLFESIPSPIIVYNTEGHPLYLNPAFTALFHWSLDELKGRRIQFVPDEQKERTARKIGEVYKTGRVVRYETKRLTKQGDVLDVIVSGAFVTGPDEKPMEMVAILTDITGLKQVEEALRESEEKYRTVLESNPDPVVVYDMAGRVTYLNPAFTRIFGWSLEERIGKKMDGFVPEENMPETMEMIKKVTVSGEGFSGIETRRYTKNGSILNISISGSSYRDHEGNVAASVINLRDITEQKRLEDQLKHSQKMEAIGTLAGGVAHDLNNILGGLVSYPELLLLQLPDDSPLRKSILTIQKSGEKAAAVIQDLLTLARRGVVTTEVVNLNQVIVEYLQSPEHEYLQSFHPTVHMETHLEKDILNILGSSIHLSKTVMNLVFNAAEAMPEGGNLIVTTENRYIDRPISGYDNAKEGDYVLLTISDTGIGISSDDIGKIFEPFYTKKKMGRSGTGLGMAVVWGTVKDHNGYIDVQSTEEKGTTFTLYFPVTRNKLTEDKFHSAIESYRGNGESILIVDDVEEQRNIASGMLEELGYSIVSVSSGEEAVEYLRSNKVDLLILDMIMDPGMDGLDTYRKILEMHSEQKAVIASGFSETKRVREVQKLGAGAYIRKPLLLKKVGLAVKEELEK